MPQSLTFSAPSLETISHMVQSGDKDWVAEGQLVANEWQDNKKAFKWLCVELGKLMIAIAERKPLIRAEFIKEFKGTPLLPQKSWEQCVKAGVGEEFSLCTGWKYWELADSNGMVNFVDFLQRFNVTVSEEKYTSFKYSAVERVYDAVLHEHDSLKATLRRFDKTGKGMVDMDSLCEVFTSFNLGLEPAQLQSLLHIYFEGAEEVKGVPQMAVDGFLVRFAMVYRHVQDATGKGEKTEEERMLHEAVSKIGHAIANTSMETLEKSISEKGARPQVNAVSGEAQDLNGRDCRPVKKEAPKKKKKHGLGANITVKIERLFQLLDESHDGFLQTEEFVRGISYIPGVLDITLTNGANIGDQHLRCLAKNLDRGGQVSIIEFLGAFCYEDNDGVTDALAEHMVTVLFWHRHVIRAACRYFDRRGVGKIDKAEFLLVLEAINEEIKESNRTANWKSSHFSPAQIADLCDCIAVDEGGRTVVPYESFIGAFKVVDSAHVGVSAALEE